jgi:peptidoglycan-N-acetylglucosamine deacetylase
MTELDMPHNVSLRPRRVALSFDNGPEPGVTGAVLDVLRSRDVTATFFIIGRKLAAPGARALAERAQAEGHRVGNHTFTHSVPLGLAGPDAVAAEIVATQHVLGSLAPDRLFRPYGAQGRIGPHLLSPAARDHLVAGGYTCVLWNALPGDWRDPDGWVERGLAQCAALAWSLVVLHDLPTGAMRRLAEFLDRLQGQGVEFTQDLPPDCLPIVAGRAMPGCDAYVAAAPHVAGA